MLWLWQWAEDCALGNTDGSVLGSVPKKPCRAYFSSIGEGEICWGIITCETIFAKAQGLETRRLFYTRSCLRLPETAKKVCLCVDITTVNECSAEDSKSQSTLLFFHNFPLLDFVLKKSKVFVNPFLSWADHRAESRRQPKLFVNLCSKNERRFLLSSIFPRSFANKMSWKENKVHRYSPTDDQDRILIEKKPDIQDLLLLGQAVTAIKPTAAPPTATATPLSTPATPALPVHPLKIEPVPSISPSTSSGSVSTSNGTRVGHVPSALASSVKSEYAAMPPPPPPPPRTPISPPTSVSSTSNEESLSAHDRADIGKRWWDEIT